jgi:hypothetical protein
MARIASMVALGSPQQIMLRGKSPARAEEKKSLANEPRNKKRKSN